MTAMQPSVVRLYPSGAWTIVNDARTVLDAAHKARALLGPANEAAVYPVNPHSPDGILVRVVFGDHPVAVHFVGFKYEGNTEWMNAVAMFGPPDFVHRIWDQRAQREIAPDDVMVFAGKYHPDMPPTKYNVDDSNEPHDPAAKERQ